MIIRIHQTQGGLSPRYDIDGGGVCLQGMRGALPVQPITLSGKGITLTGKPVLPSLLPLLPLAGLLVPGLQTHIFRLSRNGSDIGRVSRVHHGPGRVCHVITLDGHGELHCYHRRKGRFVYAAVYQKERQIALIENYLADVDGKRDHKLYLLEEGRHAAEALAWFTLYFARFEIERTGAVSVSISLSHCSRLVDPAWREKHFPGENFFGKLHLYDDAPADREGGTPHG